MRPSEERLEEVIRKNILPSHPRTGNIVRARRAPRGILS